MRILIVRLPKPVPKLREIAASPGAGLAFSRPKRVANTKGRPPGAAAAALLAATSAGVANDGRSLFTVSPFKSSFDTILKGAAEAKSKNGFNLTPKGAAKLPPITP